MKLEKKIENFNYYKQIEKRKNLITIVITK